MYQGLRNLAAKKTCRHHLYVVVQGCTTCSAAEPNVYKTKLQAGFVLFIEYYLFVTIKMI